MLVCTDLNGNDLGRPKAEPSLTTQSNSVVTYTNLCVYRKCNKPLVHVEIGSLSHTDKFTLKSPPPSY